MDQIGNISAAVDILKKLKKQVASALKTAYKGTTHKVPKTDHLVWHVSKKIYDKGLHLYTEDRPGNKNIKAITNSLFVGQEKLRSSSLSTFNCKICDMIEGQQYNEDLDSLPQFSLAVNLEDCDNPCEAVVE